EQDIAVLSLRLLQVSRALVNTLMVQEVKCSVQCDFDMLAWSTIYRCHASPGLGLHLLALFLAERIGAAQAQEASIAWLPTHLSRPSWRHARVSGSMRLWGNKRKSSRMGVHVSVGASRQELDRVIWYDGEEGGVDPCRPHRIPRPWRRCSTPRWTKTSRRCAPSSTRTPNSSTP